MLGQDTMYVNGFTGLHKIQQQPPQFIAFENLPTIFKTFNNLVKFSSIFFNNCTKMFRSHFRATKVNGVKNMKTQLEGDGE